MDFFDELAQIAQMAFAIGDFFVHDHAVKTFLGRLGQQFFGDGDVFLGGEAEAVNDALHLHFGLFNALANFDFLFAGEQGHLAHLVHVHADRVVQNFEAGVLVLLLLLGCSGCLVRSARSASAWSMTISTSRPRSLVSKRVQILGTEIVRQNVVDVVVGDVAVLLGQVKQGLDGLGQIHGRLNGRRQRDRLTALRQFLRAMRGVIARAGLGFSVGFHRFGHFPPRVGNDKAPPCRGRLCSRAASAALLALVRRAG